MSKRLDGASMFTGVNSGFTNAFAQIAGQSPDGVTLESLQNALKNPNYLNNASYNTTFASYMTSNFNKIDKNRDGVLSASEIQELMSQMATQGMTREQLTALAGASGLTSLQETVLSHFDDIDKNHDGKVSNQEIQAYGIDSDLQKQKVADGNRIVNNMSMFYDTDSNYEGSLLDYKYMDNTEDSQS